MIQFLFGFLLGVFTLLGYMIWRMMRNEDWDDSNATNAIRLISHTVLHSEDFGKMYYLSEPAKKILARFGYRQGAGLKRPFWYVSEDELSEVVDSRPMEVEHEEKDGLHRRRRHGL